jgi:hypothetical protein
MANIEKLGSCPTSVSAHTEGAGLFDGVNGLDNFDIDAAIAEAAKAAQEAVGNNTSSTSVPDDLAALISFASEQAQGQAVSTEMSPTVLSTSESAMRATNLALQTMQRNQYHPTTVQQATNGTPNGQQVSHQSQQQSSQPPGQSHQQPQQQHQTQQQQYYQYPSQTNGGAQQGQGSDRVELPPGQHASSEILYERARQAAAARSSTHARREGSHSTRRPWSPEEEKALMMGLDMVKGPHWSQILSLFGQQGRMSNILADRTQVQLKDKARNLKLFFLKTNSEMPYYLQCVTGELKTRAPTQAARKEAEERARLTSDPDDQARVSATMALGNLHNGSSQRPQPKPSPSKISAQGHVASHGHSHPGSPHTSQLQRITPGHASGPNTMHSPVPNAQQVHLAQGAQKPQIPGQTSQQTHHMPQVAPRPPQHPQNQVPLKPQSAQASLQPQVLQQQSPQGHQRQSAPVHNQSPLHQHHPQPQHQQSQQYKQQSSQQQQQHQQQHQQQNQTQPQPQTQPQIQSQVPQKAQSQPQQTFLQTQPQSQAQEHVSVTHLPPKPEEHGIKHEPLNEEEAGLLELKRFMSQENGSEAQEQSIEAALVAASAAAAAAVSAQPAV